MKYKIINNLKLYIFVVMLGAAVGVILWVFLKAIQLCSGLIWEVIPQAISGAGVGGGTAGAAGAAGTGAVETAAAGAGMEPAAALVMVAVCGVGGLIMGLVHRKYGDYPEELPVVLGKIKKDRHYDYRPMPVMLVCAFLPLVFGSSVGPEAGLTGIIAGLCYWIGDNVKYAKSHAAEYTDIGAAVMLGTLFHAPLFGIFAVEEDDIGTAEDDFGGAGETAGETAADIGTAEADLGGAPTSTAGDTATAAGGRMRGMNLPKLTKLLLYALSAGTAFLVMKGLGAVFGAVSEGFPGFEIETVTGADYALILPYIAAGLIVYLVYICAKKLIGSIAGKIPVVLKETICGFCIGGVAMLLPVVLFSGEDQMGMLPDAFLAFTPAALIGVSLIKVLMTTFCIEFGMKGGHFFPLIFACCCMGFGLALLIFGGAGGMTAGGMAAGGAAAFEGTAIGNHAVFAAAVVTAATLGAQLKKPFAVAMLMLICFPLRLILWIFVAAAIGGKAGALTESRIRGKASRQPHDNSSLDNSSMV